MENIGTSAFAVGYAFGRQHVKKHNVISTYIVGEADILTMILHHLAIFRVS